MTNTENLFEMVYLLLDKKKMTAREFSNHFGVSVRTVYRWVDSLCVAGIPIFSTKGYGGGIQIDEHYALDKTVLTEDEKISILAAVNAFKVLSGSGNGVAGEAGVEKNDGACNSPEKTAVQKIASLSTANTNWLEIDFGTWNPLGSYVRTVFNVAKSAVLKKQQLKFDYYSSRGEHMERTMQPWKIVFRGQAWYLYGWCNLKNEERYFKLSRIQNIVNTGRPITKSVKAAESSVRGYEQKLAQDFKLIELKVKVPNEETFRIMDDYKVTIIKKTKRFVTLTFQMPEEYWLVSYILSFGSKIKVLAPEKIKISVEKEIERMYKNSNSADRTFSHYDRAVKKLRTHI